MGKATGTASAVVVEPRYFWQTKCAQPPVMSAKHYLLEGPVKASTSILSARRRRPGEGMAVPPRLANPLPKPEPEQEA